MPDHAVYAVLDSGVKVRITASADFRRASDIYEAILWAVEASAVMVEHADLRAGEYAGRVRWFAIRSDSDPGWPSWQKPHELHREAL